MWQEKLTKFVEAAKRLKKFVEAVNEAGTWINEEFPKPKLHLFIRSLIKQYEEKPESEKRRVIIPGIQFILNN